MTKPTKLTQLTLPEIEDALQELDGWTLEGDKLSWSRTCGSFSEAFALTTQVALLAERRDHHPDIALNYNRLTLRLTTHDAGGITKRDLEFARALGAVVGPVVSR